MNWGDGFGRRVVGGVVIIVVAAVVITGAIAVGISLLLDRCLAGW